MSSRIVLPRSYGAAAQRPDQQDDEQYEHERSDTDVHDGLQSAVTVVQTSAHRVYNRNGLSVSTDGHARRTRMNATSFGYTLSSEEHGPGDLLRNAARAEALGFDFVSISDHFHPWTTAQGHSTFVWPV